MTSKPAGPRNGHSPGSNTVTALSGRVTKLESSMEVLSSRVGDLSQDIAASDRKQDHFHQEWRDQKEAERRQREQERRDQENFQRSRATTPRDIVVMLAAAVTTATAFAAMGSYVMDTKISGAIQPVVSRQEASAQSTIDISGQMERMAVRLSDNISKTEAVAARAETNYRLVLDHAVRVRELEIEDARHQEQIKAEAVLRETVDGWIVQELRRYKEFDIPRSTTKPILESPRRRAPSLSSPLN